MTRLRHPWLVSMALAAAGAMYGVACGSHDFVAPGNGGGNGNGNDDGGSSDGGPVVGDDGSPNDDGGEGDGGGGGDGNAAVGYAQAVLADAPLAYWSFDGVDGGAVDDRTGHGHVVKLSVGGVALVAAHALASPGMAMHVDGGYGTVNEGDGGIFDFAATKAFSIEAWVAPDSLDAVVLQRVVSKDGADITGTFHDGYDLHVTMGDGGNGVGLVRWTGDISALPTQIVAAPAPPLGAFTHVVATYDSATLRLYVNGAKVSESASTAKSFAVDAPLTLGARADDLGAKYAGSMDEIAIYDHALAPDRVAAHYAAAQPR